MNEPLPGAVTAPVAEESQATDATPAPAPAVVASPEPPQPEEDGPSVRLLTPRDYGG